MSDSQLYESLPRYPKFNARRAETPLRDSNARVRKGDCRETKEDPARGKRDFGSHGSNDARVLPASRNRLSAGQSPFALLTLRPFDPPWGRLIPRRLSRKLEWLAQSFKRSTARLFTEGPHVASGLLVPFPAAPSWKKIVFFQKKRLGVRRLTLDIPCPPRRRALGAMWNNNQNQEKINGETTGVENHVSMRS